MAIKDRVTFFFSSYITAVLKNKRELHLFTKSLLHHLNLETHIHTQLLTDKVCINISSGHIDFTNWHCSQGQRNAMSSNMEKSH